MNGLEIKEKRIKLGLTQEELANLIGVSKNTVLNYEKGNTIPESKIKILKNRNGPRFDFPVLFLGERLLFVSSTREEDSRSYEHRNNIQQTFSRPESYEEPDYVGEEGADSAPWY